MIKSVNNYPISQLFDTESLIVYKVPRYQREYTWTRNDWENLFDDLLENDRGYFIGSIICINQSKDALDIQSLELVDGQQRLTTLSLLFAAIYQALKNNESHLDEEQKVELFNLKRRLILKKAENQVRVVPQIHNNNQSDYLAVLSEIGVIPDVEAVAYAGKRRIFRAYRYFQERLEGMSNGKKNGSSSMLDFVEKVNQATIVKIEVASHADAYTLFESLNNRGTPLTSVDLIKNKLLASLEKIEKGKVDHYFEQWNKLLNCLGDDYGTQERFFRQYYNAFKGDLKTVVNVPIATRSNLMTIYEELIDKDAKAFMQAILQAGRFYSVFLGRNDDGKSGVLGQPLKDLDRIQGAPAYLLLLFLIERKEPLHLDDNQLARIVKLLVNFFVRRNLTDTPPTRDLIRLFMTAIDRLSGLTGDEVYKAIRDQLITVSANDDAFRAKLDGPIYEENLNVTRFILCSLAEQGMTRETWADLWKIDNKQYIWTIEHIFPQGEKIPDSWVSMMAQGDKQKAKEYQQQHVHRLGNLTLSGYNVTLSNKSFQDKRDRKDPQGRHVGYRNGLNLNADLAECQSWSVEQIESRTKSLVERAIALFKLNEG